MADEVVRFLVVNGQRERLMVFDAGGQIHILGPGECSRLEMCWDEEKWRAMGE